MSTEVIFPLIENHIDSRMAKLPNPKSSFKNTDSIFMDMLSRFSFSYKHETH